jgi:hypothetical protein
MKRESILGFLGELTELTKKYRIAVSSSPDSDYPLLVDPTDEETLWAIDMDTFRCAKYVIANGDDVDVEDQWLIRFRLAADEE